MPPRSVAATITAAVAAVAGGPEPLPRPRVHRAARRTWPPTSSRSGVDGRPPSRSGPATAPTRCSSTCCRPSAGPGRTALGFTPAYSMHPIISDDGRHDVGRRAARRPGAGAFDLDAGVRGRRRCARTGRTSSSSARPNNPTGTALGLDVVEAVLRRRRGRASSSSTRPTPSSPAPGTPSALTLLAGPRAARGHPHDEQGVRLRRRPAGLPRRRPRRSSTRCGWCGCPTTCRR